MSDNNEFQMSLDDIDPDGRVDEHKAILSREKKLRKTAHLRRMVTILGSVVLVFSLLGFIVFTRAAAGFIGGLIANASARAKYEQFIKPVVMYDPVPFTGAKNAEHELLLQASMWSALMNTDRSKYTEDEFGYLIIPSSELDVQCTTLFGPDAKITHGTFGRDYESMCYYDEETKTYNVPQQTRMSFYEPVVETIAKNPDGTTTLRVGYRPPPLWWQTGDEAENAPPDKYLEYILMNAGGKSYIHAIEQISEHVTGDQAN